MKPRKSRAKPRPAPFVQPREIAELRERVKEEAAAASMLYGSFMNQRVKPCT